VREVLLAEPSDFDAWRNHARALIAMGVSPGGVVWSVGEGTLFPADDRSEAVATSPAFTVPPRFIALARDVVCHRNAERFALLYRLLWRLRHEGAQILGDAFDRDVARADKMAKAVRREEHHMHAFVRFREVATDNGSSYVAWFEPEHHVLARAAPFFVRRFSGMRWSILTPTRSAHWDGGALFFGPGARRSDAPVEDALEETWRAYYRSIFNPARLNPVRMRAELPRRYWRDLPEAREIRPLIADAITRHEAMLAAGPTSAVERRGYSAPAEAVPPEGTLAALRLAAATCRACPLHAGATQTVFGEGPIDAEVMLVGEQPGDSEDLEGRPFVGPAGQLLDRALAEAGLDRRRLYVTGAVKHFKYLVRGKRRIHQRPNAGEIDRCRWWLDQERALVKPRLVVAMGASAARGVLGRAVPVTRARGRFVPLGDGSDMLVTVHPSYLLRLPDASARELEYARFIEDLKRVAAFRTAPLPSHAASPSAP